MTSPIVALHSHSRSWCYLPAFLEEKEAKNLYEKLLDILPLGQYKVKVMGKVMDEPRLGSAHSTDPEHYTLKYSGLLRDVSYFPDVLLGIKGKVEKMIELLFDKKVVFNYGLVNYYRHGHDNIGWHSDKEKDHASSMIASLSLGVVRKFRFKHAKKEKEIEYREKTGKGWVYEFELLPGSLLIMYNKCQTLYKHCVPKELKVTEGRINVTFRCIKWHK